MAVSPRPQKTNLGKNLTNRAAIATILTPDVQAQIQQSVQDLQQRIQDGEINLPTMPGM